MPVTRAPGGARIAPRSRQCAPACPTCSTSVRLAVLSPTTSTSTSATKRGNLKRWVEPLGDQEVTALTGQDILDHISVRTAGPAAMAMELGFLVEVLAAARSLWNMTIPDAITAA